MFQARSHIWGVNVLVEFFHFFLSLDELYKSGCKYYCKNELLSLVYNILQEIRSIFLI